MQHPQLRTGNPACLFDLPEMMPDGSINQPELLQHVECQLFMS